MSATTAATSVSTPERDRARRALPPVSVAAVVVAAFFNVMRADSAAEAVGVTVVDLVVMVLVSALVVVPALRREAVGWRGVVLGALGLLCVVPAFWSGLPLVLGTAALLLGYAGRRARVGSGRAVAALVLGALSVIGYLAVYVSDWIANPGSSWLG